VALQQLNKPDSVSDFDALRDYPRSKYNEITTKQVDPKDVTIVTGWFELEDADKALLPEEFKNCIYKRWKNLNNQMFHAIENAPSKIYYKDIKNDLIRLTAHADKMHTPSSTVPAGTVDPKTPSETLKKITASWVDNTLLSSDNAARLTEWLNGIVPYIEEGNKTEETRHAMLLEKIAFNAIYDDVLKKT
jgi:hypothetical protein